MPKEIYRSSEAQTPEVIEENIAASINDAIKVGLIRSIQTKLENEQVQSTSDNVIQAQVKKQEVLWYLSQLYSPAELRGVNKDSVTRQVFEKLLEKRTVNIVKTKKTYCVTGVEIITNNVLQGVTLTAHISSVKPVKQREPQLEYHAH